MIRFVIYLSLLSLSVYGFVEWGTSGHWFIRPSFTSEIILFLSATHLGLYVLITRQLAEQPVDFVKVYLGITVMRILFFGLFVFALIWIDPTGATGNALLFLVAYVLFTTLEVASLFVRINGQKPANLGQKEK